MAKLLIFLILTIIIAFTTARHGLHLHPEVLKTTIELHIGNDYMDYNPEYTLMFREMDEVATVPSPNILEITGVSVE